MSFWYNDVLWDNYNTFRIDPRYYEAKECSKEGGDYCRYNCEYRKLPCHFLHDYKQLLREKRAKEKGEKKAIQKAAEARIKEEQRAKEEAARKRAVYEAALERQTAAYHRQIDKLYKTIELEAKTVVHAEVAYGTALDLSPQGLAEEGLTLYDTDFYRKEEE